MAVRACLHHVAAPPATAYLRFALGRASAPLPLLCLLQQLLPCPRPIGTVIPRTRHSPPPPASPAPPFSSPANVGLPLPRHRHPSHPPSYATTGFPGSALVIPRHCRPLSARSPLSPATAGILAIPRHQYRPLPPPPSAIHYPAADPGY